MKNPGTIYVLINPAMPNLIKIGKTKRHVGERISELSSATGVPTQFILVFEQKFTDVDVAEIQIHTILEEKGYRVSSNREFFNAPVADALKVIQSIGGSFDGEFPVDENIIDIDVNVEDDEFGSLQKADNQIESQPWYELWRIAEAAYYGLGGEIQDDNEAFSYYAKAIKAGCIIAYIKLGEMIEIGKGVSRPDLNKALEYYKKGAAEGDYYCYVNMTKLFVDDGNIDNARKCIDKFVANRKNSQISYIETEKDFGAAVYDICYYTFDLGILSVEIKSYLAHSKEQALEIAERSIQSIRANRSGHDEGFVNLYSAKLERVKEFIQSL